MNTRYVLMKEDGFALVAQPEEYWQSWIDHKDCGDGGPALPATAPWRWANIFEESCPYCKEPIPEGIIGAWKLHNYDNYTKALRIRDGNKGYR